VKKCPVYLHVPWIGNVSTRFEKQITSAVKRCFFSVEPRAVFTTRQLLPAAKKDVLPSHHQSNVICQFVCHCNSRYVGRTSQHLKERIKQHIPKSITNHTNPRIRQSLPHPGKATSPPQVHQSAIGQHLLDNAQCALHQRCTRSGCQHSHPAEFSRFWTNRIGSGLRFYSSLRIRIRIFKFHFWNLTPTQSYKECLQRFKGCNVVHINCKCVTKALLHRTCRALQSTSPPPYSSIPLVHYQVQYNVMSGYLCKLWVVEVRDVVLLCLFCRNIYFSVHQYQLVPIYLSVRS